MCEEVKQPATQVPKAMVATIVINTFAGLLFLIPLVFVLPDLEFLVNLPSAQPVPPIIKSAMGSSGAAIGLLIPLMVLALMCGIGCTTASSRCTWAFARDGAIPGGQLWSKVNHTLDVPFNAMMLCMAIELVLGLIYFGSSTAFNAFSGVGVMSLTASYATPIAISLFTGRKQVKTAPFRLGAFGPFANVVAIGKKKPSPLTYYTATIIVGYIYIYTCAYADNFFNSLVSAGPPPLLHAHRAPRRRHHRQLRPRRLRRRHSRLRRLVLGLGLRELCRSPDSRRVKRVHQDMHAHRPFFFLTFYKSYIERYSSAATAFSFQSLVYNY